MDNGDMKSTTDLGSRSENLRHPYDSNGAKTTLFSKEKPPAYLKEQHDEISSWHSNDSTCQNDRTIPLITDINPKARLLPTTTLSRASSASSSQPESPKRKRSTDDFGCLSVIFTNIKECFDKIYIYGASKPSHKPQRPRKDRSKQIHIKEPETRPATAIIRQPEPQPAATLIKQRETRPISHDQLVAEVKGIYAGLVMVESKCIEVDNAQNSNHDPANKLNNDQWQALIALHRTLLHEHYDFFLASQHPSASPALRRLASKYAMPARMWRHGIHSFLELLRHHLPASLEHMLMFIYLAYSMMALLYETVPAFEDTWIECLGDLSRYRMAIENDDIRDRENWNAVSRYWYSKASDKAPTTGRFYHHLAILARSNSLESLCLFTKSLCVPIPFPLTGNSLINCLFGPILAQTPGENSTVICPFIRAHGIIFTSQSQDQLSTVMDDCVKTTLGRPALEGKKGHYIGIANSCAVAVYGPAPRTLLAKRVIGEESGSPPTSTAPTLMENPTDIQSITLFIQTFESSLERPLDQRHKVFPYIHVTLTFLYHLTLYSEATPLLKIFPWEDTALMLTEMLSTLGDDATTWVDSDTICGFHYERPLPEDYSLRGLPWADAMFPSGWFAEEEDEAWFDIHQESLTHERTVRIVWLGRKIAECDKWLDYNRKTRKFNAPMDTGRAMGRTVDRAVDRAVGAVGWSNSPR
ncbi:hypothetical protein QBC35DRAFT_67255 [Podospora australis]|uniref:DNA/RNA-binding domain-containing protein n=1 Tax=Podospora australis TaxID=1536484 RepID=A0AAN7AFM8_9PEZI|nr:hypothetical protein QBC35DRAFT_67255 [Podospora australis]